MQIRWSAILFTFVTLAFSVQVTNGQKPVKCPVRRETKSAPQYRIGQVKRGETEGQPILLLQVSVKPQHFNRYDMAALAKRLNEEFCNEKRLNVAITDNHKAAKDKSLLYGLMTKQPARSLRGFYDLDRVTGKEGITYSNKPGGPLDEVVFNFDKGGI
jgi:hypothetical protein